MVDRTRVLRVVSPHDQGTGFLIRGPSGETVMITALHVLLGVKLDGEPGSFVCTYARWHGDELESWEETVAWDPLVEPDLVRDWAAFRVHDSRDTHVWPVATLLDEDSDRRWSTHGFPSGVAATGWGCGGNLRSTGTAQPTVPPIKTLQLLVEERQAGAPIAMTGFSGAPIVVDNKFVVGVVRDFYEQGASLHAYPMSFVAERIGSMSGPLWTDQDHAAEARLDLKPARLVSDVRNVIPSELLKADTQFIPFVERASELEMLRRFCKDAAGPEYHIFAAGGGAGKTRLLVEFCAQMRQFGWIAGFVYRGETDVRTLVAGRVPRLFVVDYAEVWPAIVAELLAVARSRATRIRVVMLVRGHGPWELQLGADPRVTKYPESLVWTDLGSLHADRETRERGFRDAVEHFGGDPEPNLPDLSLDVFARPLYLYAAALLEAWGLLAVLRDLDQETILAEILNHERQYWFRWLERYRGLHDHPSFLVHALDTTAAVSTLLGPFASLDLIGEIVHEVLETERRPSQRDDIDLSVECLAHIYPFGAGISVLEPDPLGEQLVHEVIRRMPGFRPWRDRQEGIGRALEMLARMLPRRAEARALLIDLFREHGIGVVRRIVEATSKQPDDGQPADDVVLWEDRERLGRSTTTGMVLAAALRHLNDPDLAESIYRSIPDPSLELAAAAVEALRSIRLARGPMNFPAASWRSRRGHRRILVSMKQRVWVLDSLGVRLGAVGLRDEAIDVSREAVAISRELVVRDRNAFLLDFATALTNLGVRQTEMGLRNASLATCREAVVVSRALVARDRNFLLTLSQALNTLGPIQTRAGLRDQALASCLEAVAGFRELVADNRPIVLFMLAEALINLGFAQREMGLREKALVTTREAVDRLRELVARNRELLPNLAGALQNLGRFQGEMGMREEALVTTREAVDVFRELATRNRDAFLPKFTDALINLGVFQTLTGLREDALASSHEAVDCLRELVAHNRDAFLPGLTDALNNLGLSQNEMSLFEDALASSHEAVDCLRELVAHNRDAFLPRFANALIGLGGRQSVLDLRSEALATSQDAVDAFRELTARNRDAFLPDLAMALANLGARQSEVGLLDDALANCHASVDLLRELAAGNRDAFLPTLVVALANLSARQGEIGLFDEAITNAHASVDLCRELVIRNRDAFLSDLAAALANLAVRQSEMGLRDDALVTSRETVDLFRQLVARNRDAFLPYLAETLSNLGLHQSQMGLRDDALATSREAVDLFRQLLARNRMAVLPNLSNALANSARIRVEFALHRDALAYACEALRHAYPLHQRHPTMFAKLLGTIVTTLRRLQAEPGLSLDSDILEMLSALPAN